LNYIRIDLNNSSLEKDGATLKKKQNTGIVRSFEIIYLLTIMPTLEVGFEEVFLSSGTYMESFIT